MKTIVWMVGLVCVAAGCAANQHPVGGGGGWCTLADFGWPSADRDFDRRATLELEGSLEQIAASDQNSARLGAAGPKVGGALDELYRRSPPSGFISHGLAELAVRLRQLDCAVRAGRVTPTDSQALYSRILDDLHGERLTLAPSSGGDRLPTAR